ncbi:hypothetical protein ASZ90_010882 [hydrocarbon metagenome]|uniref:Uncharacterized protein n=1 Tax=hydrocarbon metagenome TaxID=938273 RepID=A0A0W8FER8_9ZZZZ
MAMIRSPGSLISRSLPGVLQDEGYRGIRYLHLPLFLQVTLTPVSHRPSFACLIFNLRQAARYPDPCRSGQPRAAVIIRKAVQSPRTADAALW